MKILKNFHFCLCSFAALFFGFLNIHFVQKQQEEEEKKQHRIIIYKNVCALPLSLPLYPSSPVAFCFLVLYSRKCFPNFTIGRFILPLVGYVSGWYRLLGRLIDLHFEVMYSMWEFLGLFEFLCPCNSYNYALIFIKFGIKSEVYLL